MSNVQKLECLCPHCLATNCLPQSSDSYQESSITIRCETCFSPFEVVVANGVQDTKNVIVVG